ncbi:surface-adhesin E family protein [Lysobacter capsici]|uniref:surface-adhesin E family protein n=1 Tax=Lysobacter capsici TaxID=435897 RepID=UPI001C0058BD|nr:surface-adhesin E family protein [Lysobacter capsici]QWF16370.1 hypothetical protein KME82_21855 [Lysobacter capsici]
MTAAMAMALLGMLSGGAIAVEPKQAGSKLIKAYTNNHGVVVYLNRDSLYKGPQFTQVNTVVDNLVTGPGGENSSTSLMRFRCGKKEFLAVDIQSYSELGGKGKLLGSARNPSTVFRPVERGSAQEMLLKATCSL